MMLCKSSAWGSSVRAYLRAVLGGCGVVSQSPQAQAELWEQRGECCYKYRVLCVKPQGLSVYTRGAEGEHKASPWGSGCSYLEEPHLERPTQHMA